MKSFKLAKVNFLEKFALLSLAWKSSVVHFFCSVQGQKFFFFFMFNAVKLFAVKQSAEDYTPITQN